MATAQQTFTQSGMLVVSVQSPAAISARVMTPMVFCASLVPCASDIREALPICPHRNPLSVKRRAAPTVTL